MSFYDDASLIMYPSGYKEDKLYSVKPTDGTGDFTFTRASSATRINSDGLIETVSVLGSELVTNGDFATDTDWSKGANWTISGGSANALNSVGYERIVQLGTLPAGVYQITFTISSYTNGTILPIIGGTSCSLVSGNGTFTQNVTVVASTTITQIVSHPTFTGSIDNVSIKEVIGTDVPRIDYTGGGCGSLLLEPQRTNLLTYSEDFSQWTNSNSTELANQTISPDGLSNATKIITNNGSINGQILKNIGKGATATTYTYSVFAKKGEWDRCNLYVSDASSFVNRVQFFVDLDNGNIIQATTAGSFTSANGYSEYYGNGWYRFSVTFTSGTELAITARIYSIDSTATSGDGTSGIYIYGAMLEQGSYATSYIPTSGSATTRIADACTGAGTSATFNSTEGVLFAEMAALADDLTYRIISISNGGTSRIYLYYSNLSNQIGYAYDVAGSRQSDLFYTIPDETANTKIAATWKLNEFKLYINGVKVAEDLSGNVNSVGTFDRIDFTDTNGISTPLFAEVKQLMTFNTALTDLQLESLTSFSSFVEMANALNYTII